MIRSASGPAWLASAFATSMKRIYEFVTKANQVLLFLVIIAGSAWMSYVVYQETSRTFEPPHVSIAQSPQEMNRSVVDDVRFLGQSSEVYIFGIVKRIVTPDEEQRRKTFGLVDYLGEYRESGEIVNVVFVTGEQRIKNLLPNDGLILSHHVSGKYRSEEFKPFLFLCVSEDTDGNRKLNKNDRNDLYVFYDALDKPDVVIRGVLDFHVNSPTRLVVKTGPGNAAQFWEIDADSRTKREILWK